MGKYLDEYVGQENFKERVKMAIDSSIIKKTPFPHTLMAGPPGLGKSRLAEIIAKETGAIFHSYLATSIETEKHVTAIFKKLSLENYDLKTGRINNYKNWTPEIIFIDEIHNLSRKLTEIFHTALENRTITIKSRNFQKGTIEPVRCWLPYFTLIGATNYLGSLSKPFRDRFQITLSFEIYSDEDIKTLIKNKSQKYYKVKISNETTEYISTKSRGVPRIALSFLAKAYDISVVREKTNNVKRITLEDVKKMFDIEQIDEFGLTRLDRKALGYLVTSSRPIGLKSLAQAIDEDVQTVENIIEPYLVKIGFVIRTGSGRFITDKGKDYLDRDAPDILHPVTPNFMED